jgi:hypothetical protein
MPRASTFGERRKRRASRVAEPQELCRLVEGFAGRVVLGFAEDPVPTDAAYLDQQGVAARDLQRHEREIRRVGLEGRREQMALQVVHPDDRDPPGVAERSRDAGTDQQRPDQPRPRGIGNPANGLRRDPRIADGRLDHRQQALDVVPRSEFRHHPAMPPVQLDLAEDPVGDEAFLAVVERNRGLVAGGFDAQNQHGGSQT